ncbi:MULTISPECIES: HPr family phosphocarrier protein [unclassified Arthrobacter]|uniref:HPr family phosphocarrier protein n=1 Tax=unclassified Arthrobacter TaxID=235627 RepID=UPI001C85EA57|nr:HPr family phosphocarrier protein [Arthrobacter sp. MAHUQ-56]MBX7443634.1 HPr family phosphocarrier protein [Arthrobacter sp. MAHUQ-56]
MPTQKAVVTAPVGLHARPAAVFVRAATETGLPVTIRKAGAEDVDATSLLHVMTADFPVGCEVELSISDAALDGAHGRREAEEALGSLRRLLESQGAS